MFNTLIVRIIRRGRRIALYGKIYSDIALYCAIFRRYIRRISPRQPEFRHKLECRMEYDVCTPLTD